MSSALRSVARSTDRVRDVAGVARYRSQRGQCLADRLYEVALACGSHRAMASAEMMRQCSHPSNVWVGTDLHRDDGECFNGVGTLWACGARLCPSCAAALRRRSRRRARAAVEAVRLYVGEHWRFITFTSPTVAGVSLLLAMKVYQRAWSLLRKRKVWRDAVRAGVKGVEFTEGESGVGYHVHLHVLVASKYIEHHLLRDAWTECITEAWRERGVELEFNTRTNAAVVDIRFVRDYGHSAPRNAETVMLRNALLEVSKYVCKGEVWDAVPDEHLVEVAEVKRWPRLFELFGAARRTPSIETNQPEPTPYLDTQYISDGRGGVLDGVVVLPSGPTRAARGLLALVGTMSHERWCEILARSVERARSYRRMMLRGLYPYADISLLSGEKIQEWIGVLTHL